MQFTITITDEVAAMIFPETAGREQKLVDMAVKLLRREAEAREITRAVQVRYPVLEDGIMGQL